MNAKTTLLTERLPPPSEIARQIDSCREELAALRKLLRISLTAQKADQARDRRKSPPKGVGHVN